MLEIKHANELKVIEKTARTEIKQDLTPDHNPLGFFILAKQMRFFFQSKY